MTTFSQIVDSLVLETKRPDLRQEICSYLNQTVREVHTHPERGGIQVFKDNLKEDILGADTEQGFAWDIPNVALFQCMAAVRYDSVFDQDGYPVWAKELNQPSRVMNTERHWFYRSGTRVFFRNYGGRLALLSPSWYEYPPSLAYYASADRPVVYDLAGVPTYKAEYDTDASVRADANRLCTNWILLRHTALIEEGLRAKVYKRTADTERARTSYSMYQAMRLGFVSGETADVGGSW